MFDDVVKVHRPGTVVTLAGGIPAQITAVQIWEGGHLVYQVAWWSGRERHAEWLEPREIQIGAGHKPARIGFGA